MICEPARRMYGPLGSVSVLVVPSPTSKISLTATFVLLMPRLSVPLKTNASPPKAMLTGTLNSAAMPRLVTKIMPSPPSSLKPPSASLPSTSFSPKMPIFMTLVPLVRVVCSNTSRPPIEASPMPSVALPWTRRTVVAKSSVMLVEVPLVGTDIARAPERFSAWAVGWPGTLALLISTVRSVAAIVTSGMPTSATDLAVAFSAK